MPLLERDEKGVLEATTILEMLEEKSPGVDDVKSTRIAPNKSNENGVVEQRHSRTKRALSQALVLRGSKDFASVEAYRAFVREVVDKSHNRKLADAFAAERTALQPLPATRVPSYTTFRPRVRRWSTIRVGGRTYSVPSRLIGHEVEARQHPDFVDVLYGGKLVERMPRLRGEREARIDYRHVIWSLVLVCGVPGGLGVGRSPAYGEGYAQSATSYSNVRRARSAHFYLSDVVLDEIGDAGEPRLSQLNKLIDELGPTVLRASGEAEELAAKFVANGMIPEKYGDDAMHIAIALVEGMDALLSRNFQHVVKMKTAQMVADVCRRAGYNEIQIRTPEEVSDDDEED